MYLNSEQRYNIAMRMLGIVEHMAFGKGQVVAAPSAPAAGIPDLDEDHDIALNDMIRGQIRAAGPELMSEELNNE